MVLNSHPSYFVQGKGTNLVGNNLVKFIGFRGGQLTPLNIRLGNFNRQTLQWIKVRNILAINLSLNNILNF